MIIVLCIFTVVFLILLCYCCYNDIYYKFRSILLLTELHNTPEVPIPTLLELQGGQIPSWLTGVMYRIGPGRFNIQQVDGSIFSIRHVFDGLPFMHRFELDGQSQTVKYNSRCLAKTFESRIQTRSFKGILFFGHVSDMTFFEWLYHFFARVANQVVYVMWGRHDCPDGQIVGVTATPNFPLPASLDKSKDDHVLVSKTDANVLQKIHAETLEPQHLFDYASFDKHLWGQLTAAHHQRDPVTKEVFNFVLRIVPFPRLIVFKTSENGETTVLANITRRHDQTPFTASYIHSLWLTKNYIIIPESPLTFKDRGRNLLMNGSVVSSMHWDENASAYFHLIRRRHSSREKEGLVASIRASAFFCFHVGNAFESTCPVTSDALLVLDCASFSSGDVMHQLHQFGAPPQLKASHFLKSLEKNRPLNGITNPPHPQLEFGNLVRYTLNVQKVEMVSMTTFVENIEFPRFNQDYIMRPEHRYLYGCQLCNSTESCCLIKVDLNTSATKTYCSRYGHSCSEPVFVPKPEGTEEDDGVLLSLVNDSVRDCCYLVIVDAKDMKELACIKIGEFTAITFHGSYVDHEFESINVN
ncbi:MAG: carotenoid oxygenase [Benjaminiella poitrasii]|nr:MAG: carotenoid oxygenase [Benjaminiella poitrasii]